MTRPIARLIPGTFAAEEWGRVLGREWVEIESTEAVAVTIGGIPTPCYRAKISAIRGRDRARLLQVVSETLGISLEAAKARVDGPAGILIQTRFAVVEQLDPASEDSR